MLIGDICSCLFRVLTDVDITVLLIYFEKIAHMPVV